MSTKDIVLLQSGEYQGHSILPRTEYRVVSTKDMVFTELQSGEYQGHTKVYYRVEW